MKLLDKLNSQTIIPSLKSTCKNDVIHELLDYFYKLNFLTSTVKLFSYLDTQDKEFNSASGRGVAYHYHTSIEVKEMIVVLGISKGGIDYEATDKLPCHFILLILEPKDNLNRHRKFISLFQEMIKDSNIKSKLLESTSFNEAEKIINEWENKENYDIL